MQKLISKPVLMCAGLALFMAAPVLAMENNNESDDDSENGGNQVIGRLKEAASVVWNGYPNEYVQQIIQEKDAFEQANKDLLEKKGQLTIDKDMLTQEKGDLENKLRNEGRQRAMFENGFVQSQSDYNELERSHRTDLLDVSQQLHQTQSQLDQTQSLKGAMANVLNVTKTAAQNQPGKAGAMGVTAAFGLHLLTTAPKVDEWTMPMRNGTRRTMLRLAGREMWKDAISQGIDYTWDTVASVFNYGYGMTSIFSKLLPNGKKQKPRPKQTEQTTTKKRRKK